MSSTSLIRSFNASSILRTLYKQGPCTRHRLVELTMMSPATVSRIVAQLIGRGIVLEESRGDSGGSRRSVLLRIDHAKLHVIGVQLRRDRATVAVTNLKGVPLHRKSYRPFDLDPERLISELAREVESLAGAGHVTREHTLGVGLAISGVVDRQQGTVVRSVNLGWRDVPVAATLQRLLDLPVFVENDANAAAMAEVWFGGARDAANVMYLKTEAGVGAGIILDHRLVTGPGGMAGEIGHVTAVKGGHRCRCGHSGCLEAYVNLEDVLERYERRTGEALDRERFFRRAGRGDEVARQLVDEAGAALASAVSFAAVLLDLDTVIVGGVWGEFDEAFLRRIQAECQSVVERTGLSKAVKVQGSVMGEECDLLGAVGLVVDDWFSPDFLQTPPLVRRIRGGSPGSSELWGHKEPVGGPGR